MEASADLTQKLLDWLGTGSINIFGRPFSGKDTQAKLLSEFFNASIIGGGDIIRKSGDPTMTSHIGTGQLTPQNDYLALILPYLNKQEFKNRPLILSSLGRWHGEEDSIMQSSKDSNHPIKAVINLEIDEAMVFERWEAAKQLSDRGDRNDDNSDSITTRLKEYKNKTLPVLDYYNKRGLLININGNQDRSRVTKAITKALIQKIKY